MKVVLIFLYFTVIISSSYGINLSCHFSKAGTGLNIEEMPYVCKVMSTTDITNKVVTKVTGEHWRGHSDLQVDGIYFSYSKNLNYIPQGLQEMFPYLHEIGFYETAIEELTAEDLKGYTKLKSLEINRSPLVKISGNFFKYAPRIEEIKLNSNIIQHVSQDFIESFKDRKIKSLQFGNNVCIDARGSNEIENDYVLEDLRKNCGS